MKIGFACGDFYRLNKSSFERFDNNFIKYFSLPWVRAIELHCLDESMVDFLLEDTLLNLSYFSFISIHTPDLYYWNNEETNRIFSKFQLLHKKYNIFNFVFHTDKIFDWDFALQYKELPISIENTDDHKEFWRSVEDIDLILSQYKFGLTLDLQHCFVNDKSMKLAFDFQEKFKERIVEYHIAGNGKEFLHYPLFKTKQDEIITSLQYSNIPIIIESTFDKIGEQEEELDYIRGKIRT